MTTGVSRVSDASDLASLLDAARDALVLAPKDPEAALAAIARVAPHAPEVAPTEAVDLLERACAFGPVSVVDAVWGAFAGGFAYTGWALALAMRCGHEDVARDLLARGVDLLGEPRRPRGCRALLPHDGTFTRFDLTRESPTLFLNNMDHTVSTEVFEPFTGEEKLAGRPYAAPAGVAAAADCVYDLAADGLFDDTAFDDLFRAAMVKAWHALRHPSERDPLCAETCLDLGRRMLALHRDRHMGDGNVELVMGNLVVPRADRAIVAFVCEEAPEVFLGRLEHLEWLRGDAELVRAMVPHLSPGTPDQNALVLRILAENDFMDELRTVASWPHALDRDSAAGAIQAASAAGHAEAATWLLARERGIEPGGGGGPALDHAVTGGDRPAPKGMPRPSATLVREGSDVPAPDGREGTGTGPGRAPGDGARDVVAGEREDLARRVVELARSRVIAENPFLASSFALLQLVPEHLGSPFATNGRELSFDVDLTLSEFTARREPPTHDLAHVLVHCMMLHPFVGTRVDARSWDLASDMVAEALSAELVGPRPGDRGGRIAAVMGRIEDDLGSRVTTERLYRALRDGSFANSASGWEDLFRVDDHRAWHPSPSDGDRDGDGHDRDGGAEGSSSRTGDDDRDGTPAGRDGMTPPERPDGGKAGDGAEGDRDVTAPSPTEGPEASGPRLSPTEREEREQAWRREAKSVRVDLETLSRNRGSKLGRFVGELEVSEHEQVDYRDFLRQFAVQGEEMRLSDDEFDYVFYTYGLELYGDMPLIEPLEYRDERRIRDFAIVIDTSSSVTQDVVQQFVDATFDVLTSESSFFQKTNIHIIQADQRVQSDIKISSLGDLDRWRRDIKLLGFGGTDFRPAFRYVDQLLSDGEFDDLSGLIYFTDGWGIYPERMPPYKTTFVFYDEDHRPELVPAWAMQVTLHPGEFESMSVY